jgi:hypothetical protein
MNNDLETILDTCLYQIEEEESNIDECLARYPEHAAQLMPLLAAATRLTRGREVVPDPAYRARAEHSLMFTCSTPAAKHVSPVF